MRVLITGATGFLGTHISQQLTAMGCGVRAIVRASSDLTYLKTLPAIEFFQADLHDRKSLGPALDGVDAVIHAAGGGKIKRTNDFYHQNTHTTEELVAAVRKMQQPPSRMVLVSSVAAAGPSFGARPRSESDVPKPVSHYGRSKLEAEAICLAAAGNIHVTVIRPPAIYGPRDTRMLAIFQGIQKGLLLKPPGKLMSLIYGPDCARAIILALSGSQQSGQVYYVDDGESHTWVKLGQEIHNALDPSNRTKRMLSVRVPAGFIYWSGALNEIRARVTGRPALITRDKWRDGKQPYWLCSSAKIRSELGFLPHTLVQDGIPLTVQWYQHHGFM